MATVRDDVLFAGLVALVGLTVVSLALSRHRRPVDVMVTPGRARRGPGLALHPWRGHWLTQATGGLLVALIVLGGVAAPWSGNYGTATFFLVSGLLLVYIAWCRLTGRAGGGTVTLTPDGTHQLYAGSEVFVGWEDVRGRVTSPTDLIVETSRPVVPVLHMPGRLLVHGESVPCGEISSTRAREAAAKGRSDIGRSHTAVGDAPPALVDQGSPRVAWWSFPERMSDSPVAGQSPSGWPESRLNEGGMVASIRVIARCPKIPPDNVAEFTKAAVQALEVAKGEPTTLQYDWFFNDEGTACVAFEEYEDSTALLTHVGHLGGLFGTLLELGGDSTFEVFGAASAEVRDAMAGLDVSFFPSHFQSK